MWGFTYFKLQKCKLWDFSLSMFWTTKRQCRVKVVVWWVQHLLPVPSLPCSHLCVSLTECNLVLTGPDPVHASPFPWPPPQETDTPWPTLASCNKWLMAFCLSHTGWKGAINIYHVHAKHLCTQIYITYGIVESLLWWAHIECQSMQGEKGCCIFRSLCGRACNFVQSDRAVMLSRCGVMLKLQGSRQGVRWTCVLCLNACSTNSGLFAQL